MTISPTLTRYLAIGYAAYFIGVPYRWAGDDPLAGFDCSGFMVEILKAVGLIGQASDYSAQALFNEFALHETEEQKPGCLVFWPNPAGRIIHVEMIHTPGFVIGASGGGSATISIESAILKNAFVKIRPIDYRGSGYFIRDPFGKAKE